LICGAVYKHLKEPMKFLWSGDLRMNTVHVRDVAKAIWTVCNNPAARGKIFNLADKGDTCMVLIRNGMRSFELIVCVCLSLEAQGDVNKHLEKIFGIETGFLNAFMNTAARVRAPPRVAVSPSLSLR
jgi:hypothetical protein